MACSRNSLVSFFILGLFTVLISPAISSRVLSSTKRPVNGESRSSVASYCESWRLAVETNNAGTWKVVPSKCVSSLETYYNGGQFDKDYNVVARYALAFAKTVKIGGDGKDAWVFDVDETLLSNLEYYKANGYGSEPYNSKKFHEWVVQGTAPAERRITEKNLHDAGYFGWEHLLLRGHEDQGKAAVKYKSEQRSRMVKKGYILHGNTEPPPTTTMKISLNNKNYDENVNYDDSLSSLSFPDHAAPNTPPSLAGKLATQNTFEMSDSDMDIDDDDVQVHVQRTIAGDSGLLLAKPSDSQSRNDVKKHLDENSGKNNTMLGEAKDMLLSRFPAPAPSFPLVNGPEQKRASLPCKFFGQGWCANGNSCRFLHVKENMNGTSQQQWVNHMAGASGIQSVEGTGLFIASR
ncbi:unnamed protein product [Brassica napus]|uniref:(rape) hypothetical protein n=1 Tax=Brassica napus TaxID=3708 RepID=A0A816V846_BRANA|nr:unnamed protein product [Brassica napus]